MAEAGRVVIVGAGFGGLSAAKALARAGIPLTLIDRRNHHLFQPLLYQVATAVLSPADIAVPIRAVLSPGRDRTTDVLMEEVSEIDTENRIVKTSGGDEIAYSELILATGSTFTYFGREDSWAPHAPALKSVDDALNIRRRVLLAFEHAENTKDPKLRERLMTFVIIGGGPTGVEMAGALAKLAKATLARDFTHIDPRAARVVLIEALDTLLNAYPPHLGEYTERKLAQLGVEVHTGSPVEKMDESGVVTGNVTIDAANVFWCAGVKATPVGKWLDVPTERNGTIKVGPDLRVPDRPGVFVIGDASTLDGEDGSPLPALAPVAKQQGQYVAETIIRQRRNQSPKGPFRYRDWGTMATIGRAAAVGKFGKVVVTGRIAWLLWGAVHIAYLVGFRNRITVLVNWLWAWATYAKGARLITGQGQIPTEAPLAAQHQAKQD